MTAMAIQLTIVLSNRAGVLDTADLFFDSDVDERLIQKRIKTAMSNWAIEICGNEAAFDKF